MLKGSPKPTVIWEFKRSTEDSFTMLPNKTGSELNFIATLGTEGVYRCTAENVVGRDKFNIQLIVNCKCLPIFLVTLAECIPET